ncbi:ABC transporter permease subunit [bacterium]|nr:ABC transporter permease subunit [bacterium]
MLGRQTFALVERSLRVDTRLKRTHFVRLAFAGLILLLLAQVQIGINRYSTPGRDVFENICWLNFFLLNLAGLSFFSTAITEEKEEMTLGLLRMAGIGPLGVLLGKVSPRLISAVLLLSVQLPFTFLAITLGGVNTHQILAAYVALLTFAVMLAGLGAFVSTICERSNVAVSITTGVLAALYVGPHLVHKLFEGLERKEWILPETLRRVDSMLAYVEGSTPWISLFSERGVLSTNFAGPLLGYQPVVDLVAGTCFLGLAWAMFDVCTRNEIRVAPARGLMALFSKRITAGGNRVWTNALAWKDFNFLTGGTIAASIKLVSYIILMGSMAVLIARELRSDLKDSIGATLMLSMLTALLVEIPIYLSRIFREELRWQTWPDLVLLPHSIGWLVRNKLLGILPTFIPAALVFLCGAILSPGFLQDTLRKSFLEAQGWYLISQYVLGLHLVVLLSLGVKWGALPFGIALVVIPNAIFIAACGLRPTLLQYVIPITLAVVISGVCQKLMIDKLRNLASI